MADDENRPPARANGTSMGNRDDRREVGSGQKASQRTSRRPSLAKPVEIAKFWKNRRHDAVVVSLSTYEGHNLVDVRTHSMNRSGQLVPTPKGLSIVVLRLPDLAAAVNKALAKARELGLVDGAEQ